VGYDGSWQAKGSMCLVHFVRYCVCVWVASSHHHHGRCFEISHSICVPNLSTISFTAQICMKPFFFGATANTVGTNGLLLPSTADLGPQARLTQYLNPS
jgi:hypothetical protein